MRNRRLNCTVKSVLNNAGRAAPASTPTFWRERGCTQSCALGNACRGDELKRHGGRKYAAALHLSPYGPRRWRDRLEDGEVEIDWRAHLHPSTRPVVSTNANGTTPETGLTGSATDRATAPPGNLHGASSARRKSVPSRWSEAPGATISAVARRHGIEIEILFRCRAEFTTQKKQAKLASVTLATDAAAVLALQNPVQPPDGMMVIESADNRACDQELDLVNEHLSRSELLNCDQAARDEASAALDALQRARERISEERAVPAPKTLAEVIARDEQRRERKHLQIAVGEREESIFIELGVETLSQARSTLEDLSLAALAIEKAEVEQRLSDLEGVIQSNLVRQTRAADRLEAIGGASAVARIDAERRTIFLDIEEKAVRYLELKLGVMAAGSALCTYRERHCSSMMERASEAFALMTRGQCSGLATQPVKDGAVLIALQRDGQSKVADGLSKGARFQL